MSNITSGVYKVQGKGWDSLGSAMSWDHGLSNAEEEAESIDIKTMVRYSRVGGEQLELNESVS